MTASHVVRVARPHLHRHAAKSIRVALRPCRRPSCPRNLHLNRLPPRSAKPRRPPIHGLCRSRLPSSTAASPACSSAGSVRPQVMCGHVRVDLILCFRWDGSSVSSGNTPLLQAVFQSRSFIATYCDLLSVSNRFLSCASSAILLCAPSYVWCSMPMHSILCCRFP